MENTFVILGIGNPGTSYAKTRHNVGFLVIEKLAKYFHTSFEEDKYCKAHISFTGFLGNNVLLVKPTTYVNLSGLCLACLMEKYKIRIEDIVIVLDDLNLPTGKIRFREKGSDGGHHGLESIINTLGTENIARIRVGIGRPGESDKVSLFVLSEFLPQEIPIMDNAINEAKKNILVWLLDKIVKKI